MQKEQKTYTKEFKGEAVRLLASSQKSQAQIARELGVVDSTLSQWRKDLADHGNDAFPGSGHQTPLKEENRHVKRKGDVLRQEREILKKLSASFRAARDEVPVCGRASARVSHRADVPGA
jgi:transposase